MGDQIPLGDLITALPLGIPAVIFGVGFLLTYTQPPFILYGTRTVIILVYVVLMLPFATRLQMTALLALALGSGWAWREADEQRRGDRDRRAEARCAFKERAEREDHARGVVQQAGHEDPRVRGEGQLRGDGGDPAGHRDALLHHARHRLLAEDR